MMLLYYVLYNNIIFMSNRLIFVEGEKKNRLTAIKEVEPYIRKDGRGVFRKILARCDCGEYSTPTLSDFKNNKSKSCGCLQRELARKRAKHRLSHTKFYRTYYQMRKRCFNKNGNDYKNYGGRGIKCAWESFLEFKNDMYNSFIKHLENNNTSNTRIERINNNGNYCKENCRWATNKEQARNRRSNHLLLYKGETKTLTEWAEQFDIKVGTLSSRINSYKWNIKKSLETPVNKKINKK